jgi:hypothetical protein
MPSKNLILGLLTVLNLVLLAALIGQTLPARAAFAQPVDMPANYLAATATITSGLDALYLVDIADRRLYMLVPNKGARPIQLEGVDTRDLTEDFRAPAAP